MGVGNGVGVAVGGNQTVVGVDDATGSVAVALGSGVAVGDAEQATQVSTNRQNNNGFFIYGLKLMMMDYS